MSLCVSWLWTPLSYKGDGWVHRLDPCTTGIVSIPLGLLTPSPSPARGLRWRIAPLLTCTNTEHPRVNKAWGFPLSFGHRGLPVCVSWQSGTRAAVEGDREPEWPVCAPYLSLLGLSSSILDIPLPSCDRLKLALPDPMSWWVGRSSFNVGSSCCIVTWCSTARCFISTRSQLDPGANFLLRMVRSCSRNQEACLHVSYWISNIMGSSGSYGPGSGAAYPTPYTALLQSPFLF